MHWAPRVLRALVAVALGAGAAVAGILLAVVSFRWAGWAPVVVALAMIAGGTLIYRRGDDVLARGLALGLIVGAFITVLLWPLFSVDGGGLER